MSKAVVDINADLGESVGNDEKIMPLISSCNIAAGGHYGDENSIRETVQLAKRNKLKIGVHPSFPDRKNFGRKMLDLSSKELIDALDEQLRTFQEICIEEEVKIHHIKPHGALYNQGANQPLYVEAMLEVFSRLNGRPKIYLQRNSLLHQKAEQLFPLNFEGFIDRVYADGDSLVSRKNKGALITDPQVAWKQFFRMYKQDEVVDVHGRTFSLKAGTFCIHGDQENAVEILNYIHEKLQQKGIQLA